ncbi:hypothetical protein MPH_04473 [Macrophomina phaseolina MS6]|uniref:Uncharacterized protein n=1 Tax=Macrophomina phaseolina (strain MS6) TaxID=1126212 RepID=K2RU09_MACPH|nr:hypothetical protein MPH_04473 [Macrophomina phaseolina MS6]
MNWHTERSDTVALPSSVHPAWILFLHFLFVGNQDLVKLVRVPRCFFSVLCPSETPAKKKNRVFGLDYFWGSFWRANIQRKILRKGSFSFASFSEVQYKCTLKKQNMTVKALAIGYRSSNGHRRCTNRSTSHDTLYIYSYLLCSPKRESRHIRHSSRLFHQRAKKKRRNFLANSSKSTPNLGHSTRAPSRARHAPGPALELWKDAGVDQAEEVPLRGGFGLEVPPEPALRLLLEDVELRVDIRSCVRLVLLRPLVDVVDGRAAADAGRRLVGAVGKPFAEGAVISGAEAVAVLFLCFSLVSFGGAFFFGVGGGGGVWWGMGTEGCWVAEEWRIGRVTDHVGRER